MPLSEHQSQTPETYFGGKPVLHYHATGATALIPTSQRTRLPFFPTDAPHISASDLDVPDGEEPLMDQKVDVFVNSEYITLVLASCSSEPPSHPD